VYKKIFKKERLKFIGEFQPLWFFVVSPRLELGQAEPKTAVLPLHHETIIELYFSKAVQRYDCFSFLQNDF
jgi:hypothetical protein